jgi:predicted AAA+ superfamily ATPase
MAGIDKDTFIRYIFAKLAEAPALARSYTEIDGKKLRYRRIYIKIKKYVNDFLEGNVENRLIVLPGLRGVGKTTILLQIYNYLWGPKGIEQDRILYFSTDELKAYLGGRITDVINVFVQEVHRTSLVTLDRELFILIDEAHFDKDWAQAAKIVFDQSKKVFLIITGSSALNLELSMDVARRAKREVMFPMNFS